MRFRSFAAYSLSSVLFDTPKSDFDIILALRARSVWHFDSDRGDILRRAVVVTPVAIINFAFALILLVFIGTTTANLTSDFVSQIYEFLILSEMLNC